MGQNPVDTGKDPGYSPRKEARRIPGSV